MCVASSVVSAKNVIQKRLESKDKKTGLLHLAPSFPPVSPSNNRKILARSLESNDHFKSRSAVYPISVRALSSLLDFTGWLPTDASAHGPALDHHLLLNLWIALALLALAHLILVIGLIARRRPEP